MNIWEKFKKETEKRNRKIYKDHTEAKLKGKKISMEALGQKYGLDKSRISRIIKAEEKRANVAIDNK